MSAPANPKSESSRSQESDPAENGQEFTGTADVTLSMYSRAIAISTAGTLKVDFAGGLTGAGAEGITFTVVAGQILPIKIKKIYDTGTTASGVILL
jgi:hypothetical protein